MAGPGAGHLERFEGRYSLGQPRPDRLVEIGIVDLPVEARWLVIAGVAADIASPLRAEADIAADMPGQRHRLELLADLEIKGQSAHRRNRHFHPEFFAKARAPAIGGVNDAVGGQPGPGLKPDGGDPLAGYVEIDDTILLVALRRNPISTLCGSM